MSRAERDERDEGRMKREMNQERREEYFII